MKCIDKFNQAFGFTKTESRVVLFLVGAFLFGLGVKAIQSESHTPRFDYAASDSEFIARSSLVDGPASDSSSNRTSIHEASASLASSSQKQSFHLIDINSASKDALITLPGIGEAMAERIILYREENGPFRTLDELGRIKGIGKKKLERIMPLCTVGK